MIPPNYQLGGKWWLGQQGQVLGCAPTKSGHVLDMPEHVSAMDVHGNLMVVATNDRQIISYDRGGQLRELLQKKSPLEKQTRCIAAFPD